tara:strand:+ start:2429 stop:3127 length:699 start_codon:yes stop_codon:yes gene_type:complete
MTEFGVFYQVYKNHRAVRFVLENFRKHFPDNPVILISDGGDDFTYMADEFNCKFFMRENIFGDDVNKYPKFPYNAYRTIEWWKRQKLVCEETGLDYTMIMEDDVYVRRPFNINPPFSLRGVRIGNQFTGKMITDIYNCTNQIATHYGMCGGSIYNAKTFLSVYNDVVEDIETNMDRMMEEDPSSYNMLGAVDANLTYHFSKRGYKYEVALWLGEVREGNPDLPVIHQWKEHY